MARIKVGLYGIGGLYNFGCEAIVRGTTEFIKNKYKNNVDIVYFSKNYLFDKKITDSIGIDIIELTSTNNVLLIFIKKVVSKICDIFKIQKKFFYGSEFKTVLNNCDLIYSIGGDIYTIPEYQRNCKKYRYVNSLVEFGYKANKRGKKIIIFGASIGPFGDNKKAVDYYVNYLKTVEHIYCREKYSIDYLHSIGVKNNVSFLPDPAYLVNFDKNCLQEKKYVGINLSELSFLETFGKFTESEKRNTIDFIENTINITNLDVMLIPHVLSPYQVTDNDYIFLKKIYESLPLEYKKHCLLVNNKSFLDTKIYLNECVFTICARMHCAVNSITVGVPTIFLSYSLKSKGMCEYVYGDLRYVISLKDLSSEFMPICEDMYNNIEENYKKVNCFLKKIENDVKEAF